MNVIEDLPLFWPAAALVVGFAGVVCARLGRMLRTSTWSAFLLVVATGLILAATVTPSVAAYLPIERPDGCVWDRFDPPSLSLLMFPNETSLNVVLFVPLGVACAVLRRWPQVACASVLAAGLPFAIELGQYEVAWLGRVCSTADLANNLTGLALGLLAGIVVIRPLASLATIDAVARGPR